jgi:hypothetical protein
MSGWTWSERWTPPEDRLRAVEARLTSSGNGVRRGGEFDRWDLEIRDGPFGSARLLLSVEELGGGAQLVRYRCWPVVRRVAVGTVLALAAVAAAAALAGGWGMAGIAAAAAGVLVILAFTECGAALGALLTALASGVGSDARDPAAPARRRALWRASRRRDDAPSAA